VGTPQGGIMSPLLANIFLHELDKWWEENYYLDKRKRAIRRKKRQGNFYLIRYADDFIILSNGTKEATMETKEEVAKFLEEMKLELSVEKTKVTHANDGFDFLGFHIRKHKGVKAVLIKPTKANIQKLKDKINRILDRRNHETAVIGVIQAINPIVRGWSNYYKYVNSTETIHEIYFYLVTKFIKWYRGKYKMNLRKGTVEALKWINQEDLHIYNMSVETTVKRYIPKSHENPYIKEEIERKIENPFSNYEWFGQAERNGDLRYKCLKRDNGICQLCMGCKTDIEAHHIVPLSEGGKDELNNLITLCEPCHNKITYENGWKEFKRLVESRVR